MTAKYGKISIGCAIAFPLSIVFFVWLAGLLHTNDGSPLFGVAMLSYALCLIMGIILGIVGAVKQESPNKYFTIGLLLNLTWVLLIATAPYWN